MSGDLFYRVTVDAGGVGYDLSDDLSSLTIEQRDETPDQLVVELADPYKILSHALQSGMDVEVELGTDDDHSVVFRGRIYKVDGTFPLDGVPTLKLQAYDRSMKMGLRRRNRTFTDMALSDIVNKIGGDAGYGFSGVNVDMLGDPSFAGNGIRQDDETDLSFLLRLARTYGCVVYSRADDAGDTLNFIAQYSVMTADPDVILYYGRCDIPHRLLSFQSSSDVSKIRLPRVLSGIDYDTGEAAEVSTAEALVVGNDDDPYQDENLTEYRAKEPIKAAQIEGLIGVGAAIQTALRDELGTAEREASDTFTSEDELSTLAQNQYSTSLRGERAGGTALGTRELFARSSVDIQDVGGGFSGVWYLSQVRHVLNREGFKTQFECQR